MALPSANKADARSIPSGANAANYLTASELNQMIIAARAVENVLNHGATADNVASDTAAFQAAVDALPSTGGIVVVPPGTYYLATSVSLDGQPVTIIGHGATIRAGHANGAFRKTDHGNKIKVVGIKFTGAGPGIAIAATATTNTYHEYEVEMCEFLPNSGIYGMSVVGAREGSIVRCTFTGSLSGHGIYFQASVSPFMFMNVFNGGGYTSRGVFYDGTGTGYDAGLVLESCEVMGWDIGVEVRYCDWLAITKSTIDYCNSSIILRSQDRAQISHNYIGSFGATPALQILQGSIPTASPDNCEKLIITSNTFTGHYEGGNTYDCIDIDTTARNLIIVDNVITFWTRYGIRLNMGSANAHRIEGNYFAARTGMGVAPIYNVSGANDSAVTVRNNIFEASTTPTAMNLSSTAQIEHNKNCVTEASGETIVPSGNSTYAVAHGLAYTPNKNEVQLTPSNSEAAGKNPYVNAVDATNITIGFTTATAGNAGVLWRVKRRLTF